jgi:hypothetical protein
MSTPACMRLMRMRGCHSGWSTSQAQARTRCARNRRPGGAGRTVVAVGIGALLDQFEALASGTVARSVAQLPACTAHTVGRIHASPPAAAHTNRTSSSMQQFETLAHVNANHTLWPPCLCAMAALARPRVAFGRSTAHGKACRSAVNHVFQKEGKRNGEGAQCMGLVMR